MFKLITKLKNVFSINNIVIKDLDPNKPKKKAHSDTTIIIIVIVFFIILFAILDYFGIKAAGLRSFLVF